MASKAERRKQKRREKDNRKAKARRQEARDRRKASKVRDISKLVELPEAACYASDNWHEQGPEKVWAAFSRAHPNGLVAASIFTLNLRDEGVLNAEFLPELSPSQLEGELGRRAGETVLAECEPELVVKLVDAARQLSETVPRPLPKGFSDAVSLFGDILPEDCDYEILVGDTPPEPKPESEASSGLLDRIKNLFSSGG